MMAKHKNPFVDDWTLWSGVATIVTIVVLLLWLKNAEVHGSGLLDVARITVDRYGLSGLFFLFYIGGTIIPVPLTPVFIFAITGQANPAIITALALFAGLLGSLTNFYLARLLGHEWVEKQTGHKSMKKALRWFESYGPMSLVVFGILPLPVFDVLTVFAGLSSMNVRNFLLYSFVGRFIHVVGIALITLKVL